MTAWPGLLAAMVARLPSLSGWGQVTVFDGPPATQDTPTDYVTVGYVEGEDFGGSFEQDRGAGDLPVERGTIRSELVCWTGDVDVPGMRARAFALADVWSAACATDPTWGVLRPGSQCVLAVDVQPVSNQGGSAQRLTVTTSYTALV